MKWFPIAELDITDRNMFVVIAIDIYPSHSCDYTYTIKLYFVNSCLM